MAMTIGEANAAQTVLTALIATAQAPLEDQVVDDAAKLAERSHRVLQAGRSGDRLRADLHAAIVDRPFGRLVFQESELEDLMEDIHRAGRDPFAFLVDNIGHPYLAFGETLTDDDGGLTVWLTDGDMDNALGARPLTAALYPVTVVWQS